MRKRAIATIKTDCRKFRAAFHPDKTHNTVTPERKAWQTEASQIVNEQLDELIRRIDRG